MPTDSDSYGTQPLPDQGPGAAGVGSLIEGATQVAGTAANIAQQPQPPAGFTSWDQYYAYIASIGPGGSGGGGGGGGTATNTLEQQLSWTVAPFEHYLGHPPSQRDLMEIQRRGMNYDQLIQHLRAQPSYIHGLSIGELEDFHGAASPTFEKWLGRQASDDDIKDLYNRGLKDPAAIEKYLTNRADVVALHPGAPLGMDDQAFGEAKQPVDSSYLQNLGRVSSNEEARAGLISRKGPKAPAQSEELNTPYAQPGAGEQGGLRTAEIIAPNARGLV